METRLRPLRRRAFAGLGLALLISGPWVGWWTVAPLIGAAVGFALMDRGLRDAPLPEYRLAGAWVLAEVAIAASVALTGGPRSAAVAWLALPIVTLPARFSARGVAAGVALAAGLMLCSTAAIDPIFVAHHPQYVLFPLALLAGIAFLTKALMDSDLHHRSASVIDPLTNMLNRNALQARVIELSQQALLAREPVGLIIGDLDRFKSINDGHGHAAGDAVLREVAHRLRQSLRAFDLAYRLGGEEFLIILPGAGAANAARLAETLRAAIAGEPSAGLHVTMSFGVSATPPSCFDYEVGFAQADRALYEAKRAGRNCVRTATADVPVLSATA